MLIIIRKSDNQPCGTIPSNMTAEQEILLNVIPNFGGSVEDYEVQDIEPQTPELQIISEPVDEEKVWMAEAIITQSAEIEELKARIQTLEGGS